MGHHPHVAIHMRIFYYQTTSPLLRNLMRDQTARHDYTDL